MTEKEVLLFLEDSAKNIPYCKKDLIRNALEFAIEVHDKHIRASGLKYIYHPVAVARILFDYSVNSEVIAAALLHDVVEDTRNTENEVTIEDIRKRFDSDEIAFLVESVTKIPAMSNLFEAKDTAKKATVGKLIRAITEDPRVAVIKLADRLHNLKTLGAFNNDEKKENIADESLLIYAPLAEVLGLHKLQYQIQEEAFKNKSPLQYKYLHNKVSKKKEKYNKILEEVIDVIEDMLDDEKILGYVQGRQKELYSIHQKMRNLNLSFDSVFDIIGVRIIVVNEADCEKALSIVNKLGEHQKIDDYINNPRPPFDYRSLHKVFVHPKWGKVEVQIRTETMHNEAEYGQAAHWKYKLKDNLTPEIEENLRKLQSTIELIDARKINYNELLNTFKEQIEEPLITVYTPKGDAILISYGSTPIDFAYTLSEKIGNEYYSAKIKGRNVAPDHILENFDVVEIITRDETQPKIEWLIENYIYTKEIRKLVLNILLKYKKNELLNAGKEKLFSVLSICSIYGPRIEDLEQKLFIYFKKSHGLIGKDEHTLNQDYSKEDLIIDLLKDNRYLDTLINAIGSILLQDIVTVLKIPDESIHQIPTSFYFSGLIEDNTFESLHRALATGKISKEQLSTKLTLFTKEFPRNMIFYNTREEDIIAGEFSKFQMESLMKNYLPQLSHCCSPVKGDTIVSYFAVLENRVFVHRLSCPVVVEAKRNDTERNFIYETSWKSLSFASPKKQEFSTNLLLKVINHDELKVRKNIQKAITVNKGTVESYNVLTTPKRSKSETPVFTRITVRDIAVLNQIINALKKIEHVISVKRAMYNQT